MKNELNGDWPRYGIEEVNLDCQMRCPGCYAMSSISRDIARVAKPLRRAIANLDLCKDARGGKELESMDILGGEPLFWPDLQPYIEELLSRCISPWVFTNMLAITPKMANWLKERGVSITGKLNIDPTKPFQYDLQGRMVGLNGNVVKKMVEAIRIFQEAGYDSKLFSLENLLRAENIEFVPGFYRWCLENNIKPDIEMLGSKCGFDETYWGLAASPQQVADMIRKLQVVRADMGLSSQEVLMPHIFNQCKFFDNGLFFALDGGIRSCSNSATTLANVEDTDPIRKAFESELISNRCSLSQENIGEPCNTCSQWDLGCRGGCRATVEGDGNPFAGYEVCPFPIIDF